MGRSPDDFRVPPQSLEAEQAVLGSLLISSDLAALLVDWLKPADFYRTGHGHIYTAIVDLMRREGCADLFLVSEEMQRRGTLDAVGGVPYLRQLHDCVPTTTHIEHYARSVHDAALMRGIIRAGEDICQWARHGEDRPQDILDRAEQLLFALASQGSEGGLQPVADLVEHQMALIMRAAQGEVVGLGMPTGLRAVDDTTTGMQQGELIIVGGRPGMGKSTAALQFSIATASERRKTVCFFSLEMSKATVMQRMVCAEARVDSMRLRMGKLRERGFAGVSDQQNLINATVLVGSLPLHIDDTGGLSMLQIRARARKVAAREELGLVVIDYLQKMGYETEPENRHLALGDITNRAKDLAKELNVPVLLLSQVNRLTERRSDKRPVLSDLSESGRIEADADCVWFLHRPAYYERNGQTPNPELVEEAELIVAKARNGAVGVVNVGFVPMFTRFENLAPEWR